MILSPGWRYQPRLKIIFSLGSFTVRQLPGARGFRLVLPTRTKNWRVKYNPSHLSSKLRSNRKQLLILTFPSLLSLSLSSLLSSSYPLTFLLLLIFSSEQAGEGGGGWRRRAALQRSAGGRILRGGSGRGRGLRVWSSRNGGMGGDALWWAAK